MSRLPVGGLIDRGRPLSFRFDRKTYHGFAGDTLASALVANDVLLVGRSFKYHRPRGVLTAGSEEPNALVTLGHGAWAEPNSRATTVRLADGLEAHSQNRWPSLRFDALAINGLMSPLLPAGFYYKTLMWPSAFWERLYEPLIRRIAGLGALSGLPDPRRYDRDHMFCDLLVIGAGPAGLMAALTASRAGARVLLIDEDTRPGGRLLSERHEIDGRSGADWAADAVAELGTFPNASVMSRTVVFGAYDGMNFGAVQHFSGADASHSATLPAQRYLKINAREVILATGAIERPMVFPGNDRPGVMMASAVQSYVNRYAAAPGKRVAIFTTADSGWTVARDLIDAGIEIVAIVDPRGRPPPISLGRGVEIIAGEVTEARGAPLRSIRIRDHGGVERVIAVDVLAMAGGWNPAIGLGSNTGARPAWSDRTQSFLLESPPAHFALAGAAAGEWSLGAALAGGATAAAAALSALGIVVPRGESISASDDSASVAPPIHVAGTRGVAFVDFQNDVTDADIALSVREGYRSVEHLKRYSTLGMATDQGKTSQVNGHALLAAACGRTMAETGTILSRPPYQPVSIGVLAGHHTGEHYRPERRTPGHDWATSMGATFIETGQWRRAQWFARHGERDWRETVDREVRAARTAVGICDVSTLGKIEVVGADAGILLDRVYINGFSGLAVGKARYGVMLREDGFVMDDGTTSRIADERYFVTTTTANAARVMQHIHYAAQVLWPDLDVHAVSVTDRWAAFAIAGPNARGLVQRLFPDTDCTNAAIPHMSAREVRWRGEAARLFRLSFSGELGFEVAVPAILGDAFAREAMALGADLGIQPYGTEALGVLRIEKGHVAGNELNGQTTPFDLGFQRMLSGTKDFVGATLARRTALTDPERLCLVGLVPVDRTARLAAGAHLLPVGAATSAANDQGFITSAAHSPTLGHAIALALCSRGRERHGERLRAYDPVRGGDVIVELCAPTFVDPEGLRVRG